MGDFGVDFGYVLLACQQLGDLRGIDAHGTGFGGQHGAVADVLALAPIGHEQALGHVVLALHRLGPAHYPVGVERVGRAGDGLETKGHAILGARRDQRVMQRLEALAPELGGQMFDAVHTFRRNSGIKREGPPAHHDLDAVEQRQGLVEAPLAEKAPRADDIRDDVNDEGIAHRTNLSCW